MAFTNLYKTLVNLSEKLGLNEVPVQKKGEEFWMSYNNKAPLKNLNDNAVAVLCLDLAATHLGVGFDSETAIKTSGLKKSTYRNTLHNIEKILNLDKPLSVSELCVQFSCTVVKDTAEVIFNGYKEKNNVDVAHPQYSAIAVYTACKLKKFKVQRSQLMAISRLKSAQWKELEAEFDKFVDSLGLKSEAKTKQKRPGSEFHNYLEEFAKKKESERPAPKDVKEEEEVEDYEVWKEGILAEAKAALLAED